MNTSAALFTPTTAPGMILPPAAAPTSPLGSTGGSGAISGGLLRPGAVDQATFQQMLQQQQQNRQAAGVGGKPVSMPIQSFQPAIPTLSSAQFAALVGDQTDLAADPQAAATTASAQQAAAPLAVPLKLSGAAKPNPLRANPPAAKPAADDPGEEAPTISRTAGPQQIAAVEAAADDAAPEITRKGEQIAAATTSADDKKTDYEKAAEETSAAKSDPDVVHLKSPPDKEQQTELRMRHKRWVVDETPGARQLFFGADGVFGWDDFLDLINPLQHIPIVAQIYRAVTGDEINGAANLLGAIPFGPLGGPGMIAAIVDLAVKDVTGDDIGGNLQAMVFGKGDSPKDGATQAPADMAEAGENGTAAVQTATREISDTQTSYAMSEASQLHEGCRG